MKRLQLMLVTAWPTLLIFTVIGLFCIWQGARWPTQWHVVQPRLTSEQLALIRTGQSPPAASLQDLLIFIIAVAFLSIKSTLMLRRMQAVNWITVALIAANVAFLSLYALVVFGVLFPYWFATHPSESDLIKDVLRIALVISLAWGIWTLTNVPDPDGQQPSRRETYLAAAVSVAFLGVVLAIIW